MLPISVCIIAKNEEKHIRNCLEKLKAYDWEIVVADTGSTDKTREIALQFADKVVDFTWCSDFSAAKNFVVSQASHDFVLVLDCDEYLQSADTAQLINMMSTQPQAVGEITLLHHYETNHQDTTYTEYNKRFFHRKYYHFVHSIHEQVQRLDQRPFSSLRISVCADHYGYVLSEEERQEKTRRNLNLLFAELEAAPESPYLLFQIGQCYNMLDDPHSALVYYEQALAYDINPEDDAAIMLINAYGYALLHAGRQEDALQLLNIYDEFATCSDFYCLVGNIYMQNNYPLKAMGEFLKAMTCDRYFVSGSNYNIPLYNIGLLYEGMGRKEEAIAAYEKCSGFSMAEEHLRRLISES